MKYLITVIVPSFNHARYIEETISSIYRQSYKNYEVIVIDDGSSDDSPEVLTKLQKKYGFKLFLKNNEGICSTLNLGIKHSQGDLITMIASDDVFSEDRLASQASAMEEHPEADIIAGGLQIIRENGALLNIKAPRKLGYVAFDQMMYRNHIFAPTAIFRARTFEKFGYFDNQFIIEDLHYWLKVLSKGGIILNLPNVWAHYRTTHSNQEERARRYYKGIRQTLEYYFDHKNSQNALHKHTLTFLLKLAFINGISATNEPEFMTLNFAEKNTIKIVSVVPEKLRKLTYELLLKYF